MVKELISDLTGSGQFKSVFRYNVNGFRVYYDPATERTYSGLTGALGAAAQKGESEVKQLEMWRTKMIQTHGKQFTDDYVDSTADFGSLIHYGLLEIKNKGLIDWQEWNDYANDYFNKFFLKKGMVIDDGLIQSMVFESCKHLASLLQFVYERVDSIIAIETPCMLEDLNICTPIDFVAWVRATPKASPELITINIKTSSQVTNKHLDQSAIELLMWNNTYKSHTATRTAILRTKDWQKSPTFDFKALDIVEIAERANNVLEGLKLANKKGLYFREPKFEYFVGQSKPGDAPNIKIVTLKDIHNEKI